MSALASSWIREITCSEFQSAVLERPPQTLVLVDFTATWCGPCQELAPVLERLVEEYAGRVELVKVDLDRNMPLARELGVTGVPAVFAFRQGQLRGRFTGALPEPRLREFIEKMLPSRLETLLAEAERLQTNDPAGALAKLEQAEALAPADEDLQALKATALLQLDRPAEARAAAEKVTEACGLYGSAMDVLATLEWRDKVQTLGGADACQRAAAAAPDDAKCQYHLGLCQAAQGELEPALATLLRAATLDRALARGPVKEAMVRIFHMLGAENEVAHEYRGKLAAVLY